MPGGNNNTYIPSLSIRQRITGMEGAAMNGATIDPNSHKLVKKNNSFDNEARLFYSALPPNIRDRVLSNQLLADNLFSYSYNVGSGNFKSRVVPALEAYYSGRGSINTVLDSMYGKGDSKLRGLSNRRQMEREAVRDALITTIPKPAVNFYQQPDATRVARPAVAMPVHRRENGGSLDTPKQWEDLSLSEKNDVMAAAVRNGITNLHDIRQKWNEFADGGYLPDTVGDYANAIYNHAVEETYEQPVIAADGGYLHTFKGGGPINQRARQAVGYFMNKGLSKVAASGLVGNLMRESNGLDINAVNPNGGAYGLAQWLGPRKKELFRRYGSHPTFENQLDYIWSELNTIHKKGLQMLRASKTADEAARNAFGYYEFSRGPEAAIASMNKNGKKTKWKNPDGYSAMMKGVNNARQLLGQSPLPYQSSGYNPSGYIPSDYSPSFSMSMLGSPMRRPTFEDAMERPSLHIEVPKVVLPMQEESKPEQEPVMSPMDKVDHFNALMSMLGMKSPLPSLNPYNMLGLSSNISSSDNSLLNMLSLLGGNTFGEGGKKNNVKDNVNTVIHPFTWDRPLTYKGKQYPSATITNADTGKPMQVFADNSGNVFNMDSDTALPVTFVHNLDGPTVLYSKTLHKQVPVNDNGSIDYSKLSYMDNYRLANNLLKQRGEQSAYDPNGFMDFMNIATLGLLNRGSASQDIGLAKDIGKAINGNKSWGDVVNSAVLGNEGAFKNPWANFALDVAVPSGGVGTYKLASLKNTVKNAAKKNYYSPKTFISELDWTPKRWFNDTRSDEYKLPNGLKYDAEDIESFKAHIPEYIQIEQRTKDNGTWLKMPDGSKWTGDPRSWVQMQSKDYKNAKLRDSPVYTGSRYGDIATYQGELWTSNNKNIARSYSKNTYELTYPEDINIKSYDAEGRHWGDVFGDDSYDTNAIVHENLYDKPNIDAVEIKNVIDPGASMRGMSMETQMDLLNTPYTDLVLKPGVPRKSLLGNNGDFNLSKHNMYKGLLPFGLMVPFYNESK